MEKGSRGRQHSGHKNRRARGRFHSLPSRPFRTTMSWVEVDKPGKDPDQDPEEPVSCRLVLDENDVSDKNHSPKKEDKKKKNIKERNNSAGNEAQGLVNRRQPEMRERFQYDIPMVFNRFCPKTGYHWFIKKLDQLLQADIGIKAYQEQAHQIISDIYKAYGRPAPRLERRLERQRTQFIRTVNAYKEIRKQLLHPDAPNKPTFNTLTATLEAIGCLLMNPCILDFSEHLYDTKESDIIPRLRTKKYTTTWTSERIEEIAWKSSETGVEISKSEKGNMSFNPEIEDPGKDPTLDIKTREAN